MDPLSITASIIATLQLSSEVAGYVRTASGATNERKELLKELRSCAQTLNTLLDETDDPDDGYKWSETIKTLNEPDAPLGILRAALATVRAKLQPSSGLRNRVKVALAWPFQQKEVEKIIYLIERQKQLLVVALTNDNRQLSQDIKKTARESALQLSELAQDVKSTSHVVSTIRTDVSHIKGGIGYIEDGVHNIQVNVGHILVGEDVQKSEREREDILDWLTPLDYISQQNDFIARRQQGTGKQLLESPEFRKWKALKGQTLFCPGIPGAGKTITTSIVVEHLEPLQDQETGVAYVYCNFRRHDEQRPYNLLASLLKKLGQDQKWDSVRKILTKLYDRHKNRRSRPSLEEIAGAFQSVSATYSRTFVIIDAVDECQHPDGRLKIFLAEIFKLQAGCGANIFATSRPIPDIRHLFKTAMPLEIKATAEDIELYVAAHTLLLPGFVRRSNELQEEIRSAIVQSVQGMFLLAQLHLESLKGKRSVTAIRAALTKLPTGTDAYDGAYRDAMERIAGQLPGQVELAEQVLSWITLAKRPLRIKELQHALATEVGQTSFDPDNISDIDDIVSVCVGLVTVDVEGDIIRLVHYTTQEYLERTLTEWFTNAEEYISTTCIAYLSFDIFGDGIFTGSYLLMDLLREYPLYHYASTFWGDHCRNGPVNESLIAFLMAPEKTKLSISVLVFFGHYRSLTYTSTGAHLVGYFGLHRAIRQLLSGGMDFMEKSQDASQEGKLALHHAAAMGHVAFIEELLSQLGTDTSIVDSRDNSAETPLAKAASNGHLAAVELFISLDTVDPDSMNWAGRTPLSLAAEHGHHEVVKLLLATGEVKPDSRDRKSRTPLSYAAANGFTEVIQTLSMAGADTDSKDIVGQTPLMVASKRGSVETVKALLQLGADPSKVDELLRGPLHHITSGECGLEAAEILIEAGASTLSTDRNNMTPLHYAVRQEKEDVAELLVRCGVPIDIAVQRKNWYTETEHDPPRSPAASSQGFGLSTQTGGKGLTPLHYAALTGKKHMVEVLLAHGADPNSSSNKYETPLHLAISRTLRPLDTGDSTYPDDDWTTPRFRIESSADLKYLESEEDEQTARNLVEERTSLIKSLLSHSAVDVNLQDSDGASALHLVLCEAANNGTLVGELLRRGADVSLRNQKLETPLHVACLKGYAAPVALLLEEGADPSLTDQHGRTALHCATSHGDKETILLLLHAGADPNATDNDENTVLGLYLSSLSHTDADVCQSPLGATRPGVVNNEGSTMAHLYTPYFGSCVAVLQAFEKAGMDLSATDRRGRTMLHHGAINGWLTDDVVAFLLATTTLRFDTADADGRRPLQYAAEKAEDESDRSFDKDSQWQKTVEIYRKYALS